MSVMNVSIPEGARDPRDTIVQTVMTSWVHRNMQRERWLEKGLESRKYLTASTTNDTEVGSLPWKNKTTIPKLTQISDNLQSYYMAALMPDDHWFRWEGADKESHEKANLIERYMGTKLRQGHFRAELEKIVRDWVVYGNCFAGVKWVNETITSAITGEKITTFFGPKLVRISPLDCVIDPEAKTFDESIFITRQIMSIAEFLQHNERCAVGMEFDEEVVQEVLKLRTAAATGGPHDFLDYFKNEGLGIDGFSFPDFLMGQNIELLEYWGDVFNPITKELQTNRLITIVDRSYVARNIENPAWQKKKPFAHTGWRILPDNLYGQSPLEQLVGMQYRADHLENLKADAFDQVVHPMVAIKGNQVDDFEWKPGGKIWLGADGEITMLSPDVGVLQANNEIAFYHGMMEEMAGSPRESMGFRTPGEKTAFEVETLSAGADRMFTDKLNRFEILIQRILNLMFEMLIRNMDLTDVARTFNDDTGALILTELTKSDVVADGIFRPVGSKHFAARNKRIKELANFLQLSSNALIANHISGLSAAQMLEQELGFEQYELVGENIAIIEQINAQAAATIHQEKMNQVLGAQGQATGPAPQEGAEQNEPT